MKFAKFATQNDLSKGRVHQEGPPDFRAPYQRDRDRIIHSNSFRRLMHKTQVFVAHEGDHYRTRLTHSIEVAQVARTLARRFNVNEDLAEVVALAHDLGHPPFGHTGEDVLQEKMINYGGFDHNAQALRIVSYRERHYPNFDGLNLTWESLEGIAKHNGPLKGEIPWSMQALCDLVDLQLHEFAGLEAQIAAIADDIAYNHHDLQDGLRSGLLTFEQVLEVPIIRRCYEEVCAKMTGVADEITIDRALSKFFSILVNDVFESTMHNLEVLRPESVEEIRSAGRVTVEFSNSVLAELNELRRFLMKNLYRNSKVMEMRETASLMVARTFDYLFENFDEMPKDWLKNDKSQGQIEKARLISDYISGMTDNYLSEKWAHIHKLMWAGHP